MIYRFLMPLFFCSVTAFAGEIPFAEGRSLVPDLRVEAAAFGDLDADGDPDVIVAAGLPAFTGVLYNMNGAWGFQGIDNTLLGVRAVAVGDLDRDGDLDVVAVADPIGVAWFENRLDVPEPWVRHDVDLSFAGGADVSLVDVNDDGALDIAAAGDGDNELQVWLSTGNGASWSTRRALDAFDGRSVVATDLDRDGDLDLLGTSFSPAEVAMARNDRGSWGRVSISDAYEGAVDAVAADMDGDGDPDVLQAAATLGAYVWIENTDGRGTAWTEHPVADGEPGPVAVVAADLDGDGDLDVLGADGRDFRVSWWEQGEGGISWERHTVEPRKILAGKPPREDRDVAALDLDGDGDLDVVATAGRGGSVLWWENRTYHRGARFGDEQAVVRNLDAAMGMRPADLDGDGDLDLAGTAWRANQILWWENAAGDGSTWTQHLLGGGLEGARDVFPVDLDRDGDLDILSTVYWDRLVLWWENTAGDASAWERHTITSSLNGARSIFPADVDGDGDSDFFVAALLDDTVAWWENVDDAASWERHSIDISLDGAGWVYGADLDGDGDSDVAVAAAEADTVSWFENTAGNGSSWTEHTLGRGFQDANYVDVSDLDGDGDLDVLASSLFGDKVSWWENPGRAGGSFTEHAVDHDYLGPYSVIGVDLDGDGDRDVAVASLFGNRVSWWENAEGDARSWIEHTVGENFAWGRTIRAADLDDDGLLDLVGTASNGDRISWWRNQGAQYALATTNSVIGARPVEGAADVPVFRIEAAHRGRTADGPLELVELHLRMEKPGGSVPTATELSAMITAVRLYRDDGDGTFSPAADREVAAVTVLPFDPAGFTLTPRDTPLIPGEKGVFFVTVDLADTADGAVPGGLRFVHRPELSRAETVDGRPLRMEPEEVVFSSFLTPRAAP